MPQTVPALFPLADKPESLAPFAFAVVFVAFLVISHAVRLWLATRQIRHVVRNRDKVPAQFAGKIALDAHRKAAAYTVARVRLGIVDSTISVAVLLGFTLLGGLHAINQFLLGTIGSGFGYQIALVLAVVVIGAIVDLPFGWYRQFRLEERFGFNRMSLRLWLLDLLKGALIGVAIGLPMLAAVLWLMGQAGLLWWLWAWALFVGFNFLVLVLYPTVIAPLFNKFTPLEEGALKVRIEALLARCGFRSTGLFVMDGSKRSAHGNAYFTGFGAAKRIVFFDTLITRLGTGEIEAVLAHELGHFKLKHIWKRMGVSFLVSLGFFALLGRLATQAWFYQGLGVTPALDASNDALALILFALALPAFTFLFAPIASWTSRKHEFEADAFAAQQADARELVSALVKLYEDNAATLTPDPVYSAFYDSHPPAAVRIARLAPGAGV